MWHLISMQEHVGRDASPANEFQQRHFSQGLWWNRNPRNRAKPGQGWMLTEWAVSSQPASSTPQRPLPQWSSVTGMCEPKEPFPLKFFLVISFITATESKLEQCVLSVGTRRSQGIPFGNQFALWRVSLELNSVLQAWQKALLLIAVLSRIGDLKSLEPLHKLRC